MCNVQYMNKYWNKSYTVWIDKLCISAKYWYGRRQTHIIHTKNAKHKVIIFICSHSERITKKIKNDWKIRNFMTIRRIFPILRMHLDNCRTEVSMLSVSFLAYGVDVRFVLKHTKTEKRKQKKKTLVASLLLNIWSCAGYLHSFTY